MIDLWAARQSECIGKLAYDTKAGALKARNRSKKYNTAHPYRCRFCSKWHLGRMTPKSTDKALRHAPQD